MSETETTPEVTPEPKPVDANDHFVKVNAGQGLGTVYVNPESVVAFTETGGYNWEPEEKKHLPYLHLRIILHELHEEHQWEELTVIDGTSALDLRKLMTRTRPDLPLVKLHRDVPDTINPPTRRFFGFAAAHHVSYVHGTVRGGNEYTILDMSNDHHFGLAEPITSVIKHMAEQFEKRAEDKSFCLCKLPPKDEEDSEE